MAASLEFDKSSTVSRQEGKEEYQSDPSAHNQNGRLPHHLVHQRDGLVLDLCYILAGIRGLIV